MVDCLIERLGKSADQRWVVFSPPEREQDFRKSIPGNWKLCLQSGGNLGDRMNSFFSSQFDDFSLPHDSSTKPSDNDGQKKVVIIGADSPRLTPKLIQSAFDALDRAPVVIGPSTDGGYYLIGMKNQCFDVFSDIAWSTELVFEETARRLKQLKVPFQTLPFQTDVDDWESLLALLSELRASAETSQPTGQPSGLENRLLQKILEITSDREGSIEVDECED